MSAHEIGPVLRRRAPRARLGAATRWVLETFGVLAALVVIWQLAATNSRSAFFPPPLQIARRAVDEWFSGSITSVFFTSSARSMILPSLGYMLIAWALAGAVSVAAGIVIARHRTLGEYVDPVIEFGRSIPPPALVPAFVIVFAGGTIMEIVFIGLGLFWIMVLNTIAGFRAVDPTLLATGRVLRIGRWRTLWEIILPAASPQIFAGLRLTLSAGLILLVVVQMVASTSGIGYALVDAQRSFDFVGMWAVMLLLAVVGCVMNALLALAERRILRWHYLSKGRAR